jgi:hypothetical protein
MNPAYASLLAVVRRERELVDEGRFEELEALAFEWERLAAGLPAPNEEERKVLEEIELTVRSSVAAVRISLDDTTQLLGLVHRGRRAIDAYSGTASRVVVDDRI